MVRFHPAPSLSDRNSQIVVQNINLVVGDGGAVIQEVSRLAYDYFSRLSGVTRYGTRVPLEVKQQVQQ
jgi:hypothetical protein